MDYMTALEKRILRLERSLRAFASTSIVRDTKYHITYKGEVLLTYDFNPADKIEELTNKIKTLSDEVKALTKAAADSQVSLNLQERDNASLATDLRTAHDTRDSLVVEKSALERDLSDTEEKLDQANTDIAVLKSSNPLPAYSRLELIKLAFRRDYGKS